VIAPRAALESADPHLRHAPAIEYGRRGALAHKEGAQAGRRDPGFDAKIAWLRQVLDWKDAVADAGEWLQQFKSSLFTDTIYAVDRRRARSSYLRAGATPVDSPTRCPESGHRLPRRESRRRRCPRSTPCFPADSGSISSR